MRGRVRGRGARGCHGKTLAIARIKYIRNFPDLYLRVKPLLPRRGRARDHQGRANGSQSLTWRDPAKRQW